MTKEEKQLVEECPIMIVGKGKFVDYIKKELWNLGFREISEVAKSEIIYKDNPGIIIEYTGESSSETGEIADIPVIFPFDLIDGAGVVVVYPEDDRSWLEKPNVRLWVAGYFSGYCAFWNMDGCDWLHDSLPFIKKSITNEAALKTAAYLCAKIAANIAVGMEVKHYPRFYICRNL